MNDLPNLIGVVEHVAVCLSFVGLTNRLDWRQLSGSF